MISKKKLTISILTIMFVLCMAGCTQNTPAESVPASNNPSAINAEETDEIAPKTPKPPYFENISDFEKNANHVSSVSDGSTLLKKSTSALTADTVHYEITEFGIAENMLGSEIDVVTVEIEKKDKNVYSKTIKTIGEETTQDEFLIINNESFRLTDNRQSSVKENPADDVILVTSSIDQITESLSSEGDISVNGEILKFEKYEFGNAQIIAYFRGEDFIRADVYLKSSDEFNYKGYFEGNFNMEIDQSLLKKP